MKSRKRDVGDTDGTALQGGCYSGVVSGVAFFVMPVFLEAHTIMEELREDACTDGLKKDKERNYED